MGEKKDFDLRKYLHDLYEVEKQKYFLEERSKQLLSQKKEKEKKRYLSYKSPAFEQTEYYQKWCRQVKPMKEPIAPPSSTPEQSHVAIVLGIILAIVGLIIGGITGCSAALNRTDSHMVWPLFVFPIAGFILGIIIGSIIDSNSKTEIELAEKRYLQQNEKIEQDNKEAEQYNSKQYFYWLGQFEEDERQKAQKDNAKAMEYDLKRSLQIQYLDKEKSLIDNKIKEVNNSLASMYDLSIDGKMCLHPAYRGLSSVAVLYGYIDTGRCKELEGHEGAYNIFEQERRLGYIIDKLDVISNKLDKLNGTMMYMGRAVSECYYKLDELNQNSIKTIDAIQSMDFSVTEQLSGLSGSVSQMSNNISNAVDGYRESLHNIEVNTANSAYYSQIGSEAAEFTAYYNMFKN